MYCKMPVEDLGTKRKERRGQRKSDRKDCVCVVVVEASREERAGISTIPPSPPSPPPSPPSPSPDQPNTPPPPSNISPTPETFTTHPHKKPRKQEKAHTNPPLPTQNPCTHCEQHVFAITDTNSKDDRRRKRPRFS